MKKYFFILTLFSIVSVTAQQNIILSSAKFKTGDDAAWKEPSFNDAALNNIRTNMLWELQGYDYDGYAWYRFHFKLPSSVKANSYWKDTLRIFLSKIDDEDQTFFNGVKIGQTGSFPDEPGGYAGKYDAIRDYRLSTKSPLLHWDADNVIAIRVYDGGGGGGMYGGMPYIGMMDIIDGVELSNPDANTLELINHLLIPVSGKLTVQIKDGETNNVITGSNQSIELAPLQTVTRKIDIPEGKRIVITAAFKEKNTGKLKDISSVTPYILTPLPPRTPRINGAKIVGVRPSSPLLYKIAATGQKPLNYEAENLPMGLVLEKNTGVISGELLQEGEYKINLKVSNSLGKDERVLTVKAGDELALTPAMGWNSWNCWGLSVSDSKVKSSAQAMIDKGLVDHGWTYINIDDGWDKPQRAADGSIVPNEKFPDMKALGDWLHTQGLKFGIYSSPGPLTCGGYTASYRHEMQDATSYANWGIDYLKYDWCSYNDVYKKEGDTSVAAYMKPYQVMQHALKAQSRDIYFSLCQYGMKDVWKWGPQVGGNSWRTTGDITDSWESLSGIGFSQDTLYHYAAPGHWNDPDMLIAGLVGWGDQLYATRLNPDEQYTHISLWCLLSAPLLIGCDISRMDDFTLNLLTNDEVLALDQDPLGKQAQQKIKNDNYQVWVKELEDGSEAVGIFNLSEAYQSVSLKWNNIGLGANQKARDLWRQKDLGIFKDTFTTNVAPHGVTLVKVWQ